MSRIFVPEPAPHGMRREDAEWIMRQLQRVFRVTQVADEAHLRAEDHIKDFDDPHQTLVPWTVEADFFDLYPNTAAGGDAGIGTIDKPAAHIAIGTQEADGVSGIEGVLYDGNDTYGGGVALVGLRDIDPANLPDPITENAPVYIFGNPVTLGNQVMVELENAITEDHEVIFGPTVQIGTRYYSPLLLGPKKVYSQTEEVTDALDHLVLDLGEVEIVSLTLVNSYVVGATFFFQVYLENLGNKATDFDVIIKQNGIEAVRYPRTFTGNGGVVTESFPIVSPISAGEVISLDVEAISTHPNSQGWVRGTIQATILRMRQ